MRRPAFAVVVIALLVVGAVVMRQRWVVVRAQEASPVAGVSFEQPPGLAVVTLQQLVPIALPEEPAALTVLRLTGEPGAEVPVHPHPGLEIALIEAGSATLYTSAGPPMEIIHGAAETQAAPEDVGPGEELTLVVGDIAIFGGGTFMGGRAGDEGATLLVFDFDPLAGEATPEA